MSDDLPGSCIAHSTGCNMGSLRRGIHHEAPHLDRESAPFGDFDEPDLAQDLADLEQDLV